MAARLCVPLAFLTALAACATAPAAEPRLQIAMTLDDLPVHGPYPPGQTPLSVGRSVIAALADNHVPAYGMVNAHWVADRPDTLEVLKDWRGAGLLLASHGLSHRHLSEMNLDQFEQELTRNEPVLAQLSVGTDWHWFRYPFLDEGKDDDQRARARQILAKRGYKIAAVTMDFGDWQWTAPYARCSASGDRQAIERLEQMYLAAAHEGIGASRAMAHGLYGRDIPYVLLLHESAFEARMLPRLVQLYRSTGFRLVSLPEAEKDPTYAEQVRPDLPAEAQGLEGKTRARGLPLPKRTDYSAELSAICPAPATAPTR
jgi:peptidoglycan/xylan/chitin deacetylase (PgdA/CDA1 family)